MEPHDQEETQEELGFPFYVKGVTPEAQAELGSSGLFESYQFCEDVSCADGRKRAMWGTYDGVVEVILRRCPRDALRFYKRSDDGLYVKPFRPS